MDYRNRASIHVRSPIGRLLLGQEGITVSLAGDRLGPFAVRPINIPFVVLEEREGSAIVVCVRVWWRPQSVTRTAFGLSVDVGDREKREQEKESEGV